MQVVAVIDEGFRFQLLKSSYAVSENWFRLMQCLVKCDLHINQPVDSSMKLFPNALYGPPSSCLRYVAGLL